MPYIYLIIAISTEVIGSAFLKSSEGFSKFIPSLGTIISFGICFYFLSKTNATPTTKYNLCNLGGTRFSLNNP